MKLSVKWLTGLTLMALVAVAVVGLSHSASAAVDGKVYVTNTASNLTTEPGQNIDDDGRLTASTVYATYKSDLITGTTARDIVVDSNFFIVTVLDEDENVTSTVTSGGAGGYPVVAGGSDVVNLVGSGFNDPGEQVQVTLTASSASPIIGDIATISIVQAGIATLVTNTSVKAINYAGDGTNSAIITIGIDFGSGPGGPVDFIYSSSDINVVTASVKSVIHPTGTVVTLTETGRDTGRFEGYVKIVERTDLVTVASPTSGPGSAGAAVIPTSTGPITMAYNDAESTGSDNKSRTAKMEIDITSPTATITSPTTGSETQNRRPTFAGNVTDNQSGLDVSTFELYVDQNDDAADGTLVIAAGDTNSVIGGQGTVEDVDLGVAAVDGLTTIAFSHTPPADIPTDVSTSPDNIVDFQVRIADLAGNYGYSDSDSALGNIESSGRHGNQPHTVKVDQVNPSIATEGVETGIGLDTSVSPSVDKEFRDTIKVTFDGNVKESSISAGDFKVELGPDATGATLVPASVIVKGAAVYLDLDVTIPSDNIPKVTIQGTIQDLAGNSTDIGSDFAIDKLAPVITLVISGGTGTGTGSEAADSLTKDKVTLTVTSDEDLLGPPLFTVTDIDSDGVPTVSLGNVTGGTTAGLALGNNTWSLEIAKGGSADGARAVSVSADDIASNNETAGEDDEKAFTLDTGVATAISTPANLGTTTQANPFITTDYATNSEASTLSVTEATLDDVDVTASVIASADSKTFFFQPTTALTNASHTYVLEVLDAAGNSSITTTKFTKSDRTAFSVPLFAGWNLFSLPSNPLDTDVNAVLTNTGVKQIVAYDATTPSQPWRIASKVGAAAFASQTTPGLTNLTAGPGYWIETADFEDQSVALEGPTGPGDARPGLVTIPTGNGWNLVGAVDQSRTQTQKSNTGQMTRTNDSGGNDGITVATYFNTVNNGRAYTFDTVTSKFQELEGSDAIDLGAGIWVFISPQDNGQLPHIVP